MVVFVIDLRELRSLINPSIRVTGACHPLNVCASWKYDMRLGVLMPIYATHLKQSAI